MPDLGYDPDQPVNDEGTSEEAETTTPADNPTNP